MIKFIPEQSDAPATRRKEQQRRIYFSAPSVASRSISHLSVLHGTLWVPSDPPPTPYGRRRRYRTVEISFVFIVIVISAAVIVNVIDLSIFP